MISCRILKSRTTFSEAGKYVTGHYTTMRGVHIFNLNAGCVFPSEAMQTFSEAGKRFF